ncbi:MAG: hypothetical protein WC071_05735, partial [Victivallaceae bacterium]
MVNKNIIITLFTLVLIIVTIFLVWNTYFNKSDKDLINEQLTSLRTLASKYPGEGTSSSIIKSKSLENLFAPSCKLDLRSDMFSGDYTQEEISANAVRYRSLFNHAVINLHDIEIELISATEAKAEFTGSFDGITKSGNRVNEYRDLTCLL